MIGFMAGYVAGLISGMVSRDIIVKSPDRGAYIKIGEGCRGMSPQQASKLAEEVHKALLKISKDRA